MLEIEKPSSAEMLELSVVIPCLNEHETIGVCVEKAVRAMREAAICGEVSLPTTAAPMARPDR